VLAFAYLTGGRIWFKEVGWWHDPVPSWLHNTLMVPHHVPALCAAFVGFIALAQSAGGGDLRRTILAAFAFASMAGMSVHIAIGAAVTAGVWLIVLLCARRFADSVHLMLAGMGAIFLAAPWLLTPLSLLGGDGPPPIAIRLRGPLWIDAIFESDLEGGLVRAVTMPFFYAIEFGIFGLGAFAFWRRAGRRGYASDLAQLLVIGTASSFMIAIDDPQQ